MKKAKEEKCPRCKENHQNCMCGFKIPSKPKRQKGEKLPAHMHYPLY